MDIVEKTVKDILQMMVSEGVVQSDKIGTSNCGSCSMLHTKEGQARFTMPSQSFGRFHLLAVLRCVDSLLGSNEDIERSRRFNAPNMIAC